MSLCITYRTENGKAITISDSLLTTIKNIDKDKKNDDIIDSGSFLPSDQKIVHQTPYGIKVHIISQKNSTYASSRFDIVVSIAGNVSLGLQSLLHVDAILQGSSYMWDDQILWIIEDKIRLFWNNARDQSLQMSFVITKHKRKTKFFELYADNNTFEFFEVEEEHGLLISVIGDGSADVKEEIYKRINSLSYSNMSLNQIIHKVSIGILLEIINSTNSRFIGGSLQGAIFNDNIASYLKIKTETEFGDYLVFYRGAEIESYESKLIEVPLLDLTSPDFPIILGDINSFVDEEFTI